MITHEAMRARQACEALFHAFHGLIDDGRARAAIDLFVDEAVFELRGEEHRGRDAILRFLTAREARADRRTRHAGTNFRFRLTSENTATASALLIVFAAHDDETPPARPEAVTDCEMAFRHSPAIGWRITERRHRRFASGC
jgi:hypothetical protein